VTAIAPVITALRSRVLPPITELEDERTQINTQPADLAEIDTGPGAPALLDALPLLGDCLPMYPPGSSSYTKPLTCKPSATKYEPGHHPRHHHRLNTPRRRRHHRQRRRPPRPHHPRPRRTGPVFGYGTGPYLHLGSRIMGNPAFHPVSRAAAARTSATVAGLML
jgi:hypothetical protein